MHIPPSNPFERAFDAWQADIDAEAARLLESGEASNPTEARSQAERNVQARRAMRGNDDTLDKVISNLGDGPMSGGGAS